MKLLLQRAKHDCLLYAFAMAFDEDVISLMHEVGYRGDEFGYHWQSFVDAGLVRGLRIVEIQAYPTRRDGELASGFAESRFQDHLDNTALGVVLTEDHALAYNGRAFFDPRGFVTPKDDFQIPLKAILQIKIKS